MEGRKDGREDGWMDGPYFIGPSWLSPGTNNWFVKEKSFFY